MLVTDNHEFSCGRSVGLFLKTENNFHIRDDLRLNAIENLWVETQDLIIGVLDKPANLLNREFLDLLEETLHTIHLSKKKYLIMSDVKINTLKKSNNAKEYLNLVRSVSFRENHPFTNFKMIYF